MDLIQLKMPPDRVRLMADAIERDLATRNMAGDADSLRQIVTWLRYRLSLWDIKHPETTRR